MGGTPSSDDLRRELVLASRQPKSLSGKRRSKTVGRMAGGGSRMRGESDKIPEALKAAAEHQRAGVAGGAGNAGAKTTGEKGVA